MIFQRIKNYTAFSIRALSLIASHRSTFVLFIVLSIITALTEGVGVAMMVPILESIGERNVFSTVPILSGVSDIFQTLPPHERLRAAALTMLAVVFARGALLYAVQYLAAALPQRIRLDLSMRAYDALIKASFGYMLQVRSGTLQNVVKTLPDRIAGLLSNYATIFINVFVTIVYLVMMVAISWQMTLAALVFLAVVSEGIKKISHHRMREFGRRITVYSDALHQILYETLNGFRLIRLSSAEGKMSQRWHDATQQETQGRLHQAKLQQAVSPLFATASGALICVLILVASYGDESTKAASTIVLFMFLLFRLQSPISSLNNARIAIQANVHAFEETDEVLAQIRAQRQKDGNIVCPPLRTAIQLENVCFSYPSGDETALTDISMIIDKGQMVAIVGPSGAGKSTLVGLIARFFDPNTGHIRIDGTELRDLKAATWHRRIGMVSQDIILFNDTVRANIAFGREDVGDDAIREASKQASADEFINGLPDGYNTLLGERGARLSGGQQQRIALARAILADPDLLILDEATSHLDSITERAIQKAVERLRHDRTIIVIAHRLSTIRMSDKIVVVSDGKIIESGKHNQLIKARGTYWEMMEQQRLDLVEDE